jgi:hypothetical protein
VESFFGNYPLGVQRRGRRITLRCILRKKLMMIGERDSRLGL